MSGTTPNSGRWKSSTTIAAPSGTVARSLTSKPSASADGWASMVRSSAVSAPKPGIIVRIASIGAKQKRRGVASASSQASHTVDRAGRVAAQVATRTLLPEPADPVTSVNRAVALALSRLSRSLRGTTVSGRIVGLNLVNARRAGRDPGRAVACASGTLDVPPPWTAAQPVSASDGHDIGVTAIVHTRNG